MFKILKYSFYDLIRSRWSYVYLLFYLLLSSVLLFLNNDLSNAIITLLNVVIVLVPLIATIFGIMYYYNSREFTELLLAQPVKRSSIFRGSILRCCRFFIYQRFAGIRHSICPLWIISIFLDYRFFNIDHSFCFLEFYLYRTGF